MKHIFKSLIIFSFLILGLASSAINFPQETKRLKSINVKKEVLNNTQKGDFRFVSVYGFAEIVPGVENYPKNYSKYGKKPVEGTSDAIQNKEQGKFNEAAMTYATKYNHALIKIIEKK